MVHLFIDETETNIGKLQAALESQDEETLKKVAHTMKGAAAHICTDTIVSKLKAIEADDLPFAESKHLVDKLIPLLQDTILELESTFSN